MLWVGSMWCPVPPQCSTCTGRRHPPAVYALDSMAFDPAESPHADTPSCGRVIWWFQMGSNNGVQMVFCASCWIQLCAVGQPNMNMNAVAAKANATMPRCDKINIGALRLN